MKEEIEIQELIEFLRQKLDDLPDTRKPGNNTRYQNEVENAGDCINWFHGIEHMTATHHGLILWKKSLSEDIISMI